MDFDFSPEQLAFLDEVEAFLDANDDPIVFDVTRENMAQIVDTPSAAAFMAQARRAGLARHHLAQGVGRPGGRRRLRVPAQRGARRPGRSRRSARASASSARRSSRHGSEKLKKEFLPKILRNEIEFAVGYSEPDAGSDAASMKLKATRDGDGWRLNGQKTWTTSAHFAEWYWVGARTDPEAPSTTASRCSSCPLDDPGITDQRHLDDGRRAHQRRLLRRRVRARRLRRRRAQPRLPVHLRGARPRALHDVHVLPHQAAPRPAVRLRRAPRRSTASRSRTTRSIRKQIARLATEAEVARVLGLRFVAKSMKGGAPPTTEASEYKLFATELSKRLAERVDGHRRRPARSCG